MSDRFDVLRRVVPGSPKVYDQYYLGMALALPPQDERRIHFQEMLEQHIEHLERQLDSAESGLARLLEDRDKWPEASA